MLFHQFVAFRLRLQRSLEKSTHLLILCNLLCQTWKWLHLMKFITFRLLKVSPFMNIICLPEIDYKLKSREEKHVLLFRRSEILHFKVSITNMPHFFVCQDRKLKLSASLWFRISGLKNKKVLFLKNYAKLCF